MSIREFVKNYAKTSEIFAREDLKEMSLSEFQTKKEDIYNQIKYIGMPNRYELKNSDEVVYVKAYKRADGTNVRAHYRARPDDIKYNNFNNSDSVIPARYTQNFINNSKDTKIMDNAFFLGANVSRYTMATLSSATIVDAINDFENTKKFNRFAKILNSVEQIPDSGIKDILENRIKIPKRTRGVYYDFKSRESKALFDTFEIKKYIFNNYFELKRGTSPIISYIEFPKWQTDAFLALQHCTLYRPHITKDGYFDAYVVDYYDFSKRSKKNDPYVWLNNYAYDIQERGGLENYFLVYHIHEKAGILGEIREWVK